MTPAWRVGTAVAIGGGLFWLGRFSAPTKVVTRTETKTQVQYVDRVVEKVVYQKVKDVARHVETTTTKAADGTVTVVRVEDAKSHSDSGATKTADKTTNASESTVATSTKEVDYRKPDWRLSAHAGWDKQKLDLAPSVLGGEVDRRILGPLWLGAWAHTDGTAGISLGAEF